MSSLLLHGTLHFWHFCSPNMCEFSHQTILHDAKWGTYSLTQFWCFLPGDSIRSHRLRTQSHKSASSSPPWSGGASLEYPPLPSNLATNSGFHDPFLRSDWFARAAHRTLGNTYFFFFFTSLLKDVIKRIPMGRHNVKVWEGTKCKSFSPNGYELVHSPGTWMCTPLSPEAPFTPTAVPL